MATLPHEQSPFASGFATGQLLPASRAARRLGIPVSTFGYHLRAGHIPFIRTPSGTNYVWAEDADAFGQRLEAWRKQRNQAFDQVEPSDESEESDEFDIDIPSIPPAEWREEA